jgi:hypothetical protein
MTSTLPGNLFQRIVAIRVGEGILIGFAVLICLAGADRANRQRLETIAELTAAGDRAYFPAPDPQKKAPEVGVAFRGQQLVAENTRKINDAKMLRAGKND